MRFWFAPSSDVPIYRQLATQITLAILSQELCPGERLPSTREMARRFGLHQNTISAGYRQLEQEGWCERRHGSGVYVRRTAEAPTTPERILDHHIAAFFRAVRELNLPAAVVRARVAEWLASASPDHFLVVDPDEELRRILITEIAQCNSLPAHGTSLAEIAQSDLLNTAIPVCRPSKAALVRASLPVGVELITLQIRSANAWLAPWLPAPEGHLVAVVSHWPDFLDTARTMLISAGVSPDALIFRDARQPRWRSGLDHASVLLCDAYTATLSTLPKRPRKIIFTLLADAGRDDLVRYSRSASL